MIRKIDDGKRLPRCGGDELFEFGRLVSYVPYWVPCFLTFVISPRSFPERRRQSLGLER